jgi:2-dehydropantoate 2-reductase
VTSIPITIYGSGAIGGIMGAFMAKAGEDVLFVDKAADHVAAMNATGLRISGAKTLQIPAQAVVPKDLKGRWVSFSRREVAGHGSRARHDRAARRAGHGGRLAAERHEPARHRKALGKERVVGAS